jgi:hypothetical protein
MINPDQYFKDKLYQHELPLSPAMSLDAVMERRKKKRRGFFWFSLSSVLVLLVSMTAAAMGWQQQAASTKVQPAQDYAKTGNPSINKSSIDESPEIESSTSASPLTSGRISRASGEKSYTQNATGLQMNPSASLVNSSSLDNSGIIASNELPVLPVLLEDVIIPGAMITDISWMNWLKGRGIFHEFEFVIEPTTGEVLPEFSPYNPPRKTPFRPMFELNAATAGNGYKYFRESKDVTVAGNHRFSQYQAMMLFDMGRGLTIGTGLGYLESVGVGKALISNWKEQITIDTHVLVVRWPSKPKRIVTVYDTTSQMVRQTLGANITYRLNKLSLPLGIRYQLGYGRNLIRISATAMPGIVTVSTGKNFNRDAVQSMDLMKKHAFSLDARFGAGFYYQISPKTAMIAEPMIQFQSISGKNWQPYNRWGLGFGLGVVLKP